MNMSISDGGSSNINPDEWERIARYIADEAGASEAEATRHWIEADPHRVAVVQLLRSVHANVAQAPSPEIDVESALSRVKARFEEPKIIPFAPRLAANSGSRSLSALLRVAAAAVIITGATVLWQNTRRSKADGAVQTYATAVGERRAIG